MRPPSVLVKLGGLIVLIEKVRRNDPQRPDDQQRCDMQRIGCVKRKCEQRYARTALSTVAQNRNERKQRAEGDQHPAQRDAGEQQAERIDQQNAGYPRRHAQAAVIEGMDAQAEGDTQPAIADPA